MLDIKKLDELSKYLNLREVCESAEVQYSTITQKLNRYRRNHDHGELKVHESHKLEHFLCNFRKKIGDSAL